MRLPFCYDAGARGELSQTRSNTSAFRDLGGGAMRSIGLASLVMLSPVLLSPVETASALPLGDCASQTGRAEPTRRPVRLWRRAKRWRKLLVPPDRLAYEKTNIIFRLLVTRTSTSVQPGLMSIRAEPFAIAMTATSGSIRGCSPRMRRADLSRLLRRRRVVSSNIIP
jgi:hypothetical protein